MRLSRRAEPVRFFCHAICAIAVVAYVVGSSVVGIARMRAAATMQEAALSFVAALSSTQKAKATMSFDDTRRTDWHFIPRERKGIAAGELTPQQRVRAKALVKTIGPSGAKKVETIMAIDNILRELEAGKLPTVEGPDGSVYSVKRGDSFYSFAVYGEPSSTGRWGWSVEGHHVSVNVTVVNGQISSTPLFLGAAPAEVKTGPSKGLRPFAAEQDAGRALLASLDQAQRKIAIVSPMTPGDIISFNNRKADPLNAPRVGVFSIGLQVKAMREPQKAVLRRLLDAYMANMPEEVAEEHAKKVYAARDFERIAFAWSGSTAPGEKYYFRVQGPSFLIEHDGSQVVSPTYIDGPSNHIHSVWRDFDGDFGEDLLLDHYEESAHTAPLLRPGGAVTAAQ
jgi:hypothetical protein